MRYKIGIYGSAAEVDPNIVPKLQELGKELAKQEDVVLVTGAAPNYPYVVAKAAYDAGAELWGFPPWYDGELFDDDPEFDPEDDLSIYSQMFYIPEHAREYIHDHKAAKMYRDFRSTQMVDAGIIVNGRWGTLNEFTNLIEMKRVIGVLSGSGGTADLLPGLTNSIKKPDLGPVIFKDQPKDLVNAVINFLKE